MAEVRELVLGLNAWARTYGREPEIRVINRFFEQNPTNLATSKSLLSRPGTRLLASLGAGNIRRCWSQRGTFNDALFVVSGDALFRVNTDFSVEAIDGTVNGLGTPEIDSNGQVVFIADGTALQFYGGSGAPASGTLTLTGNAVAGETVTVGTQVYTWVAALTASNTFGEVVVGASAAASIDNLIAAINAATGGGTTYGSDTTINQDVTASDGAGTSMNVSAKLSGTAGNSIVTTETMTNASWGGATLSGGSAGTASGTLTLTGNAGAAETVTIGAVVYTFVATLTGAAYEVLIGATASDSLDNLIAAINAATGAGTVYGTGTVYHPQVRAAAGPGDTMDVVSRAGGSAYNSVATTETLTNGSWGGATLSGGSNAALQPIAVPDGQAVVSIGVVSQYVVVVISNSQRWYFIRPAALNINALDFYTAESKPDELISVVIVGDQAWLCGSDTVEPWYVSGDSADDPFSRLQQRVFARGVIEGTTLKVDDVVILVGDDGVVYSVGGGVKRISTHGIEETIRKALKTQADALA